MKTSQLKMIIREVVREEIRLGLQEIIGDMNKPKQKSNKPVRRVVEKQNYSKNPVINEVLNETAMNDGWKTMGNKKYTSDDMGDVLSNSYKDLMNDDSANPNKSIAASMGVDPDDPSNSFLTKDYRSLMKAVDKKQGK